MSKIPRNTVGGRPFQILQEFSCVGRTVPESKKKCVWKFCFGEDGDDHTVSLVHSTVSGKKTVTLDGVVLHQSQTVAMGTWDYAMQIPPDHIVRIEIRGNVPSENFYELLVDNIAFNQLTRRGAKAPGHKGQKPQSAMRTASESSSGSQREADHKPKLQEKPQEKKKKQKPQQAELPAQTIQEVPDFFSEAPIAPQPSQSFDPFASAPANAPPAPSSVYFDPFSNTSVNNTHSQLPVDNAAQALAGLSFDSPAQQHPVPTNTPSLHENTNPSSGISPGNSETPLKQNSDLWSSNIVNLDIKNNPNASQNQPKRGSAMTMDEAKKLTSTTTGYKPSMKSPGLLNANGLPAPPQLHSLAPAPPKIIAGPFDHQPNPFDRKVQGMGQAGFHQQPGYVAPQGQPLQSTGNMYSQKPQPTPFD